MRRGSGHAEKCNGPRWRVVKNGAVLGSLAAGSIGKKPQPEW